MFIKLSGLFRHSRGYKKEEKKENILWHLKILLLASKFNYSARSVSGLRILKWMRQNENNEIKTASSSAFSRLVLNAHLYTWLLTRNQNKNKSHHKHKNLVRCANKEQEVTLKFNFSDLNDIFLCLLCGHEMNINWEKNKRKSLYVSIMWS